VQGGLLLNVVVSKSATILKLLASKNQTLLVRRNACKIKKVSDFFQNTKKI